MGEGMGDGMGDGMGEGMGDGMGSSIGTSALGLSHFVRLSAELNSPGCGMDISFNT